MANLIVDIGNVAVKAAWAEGTTLGKCYRYQGEKILDFILEIISREKPSVIIVSSSRNLENDFFIALSKECSKLIVMDGTVPLPVSFSGDISEIGTDRIASVVAVNHLFKGRKCMVFDFGTVLSVDFIDSSGKYLGGNISLGMRSRYKAVNRYAVRMPLLGNAEKYSVIGNTLSDSIHSGVNLGIIFELEGYLRNYPDYMAVFTGGDAFYFAEKLKSSIFVVCNLVLMGLALIADYNEKN